MKEEEIRARIRERLNSGALPLNYQGLAWPWKR